MSKIDDILDLLSDNFGDLRKELQKKDLPATALEVDRLDRELNELVHYHCNPLCWSCEKRKPFDEFKPESLIFPQRICRSCFEACRVNCKRSDFYWMRNVTACDRWFKKWWTGDLHTTHTQHRFPGIKWIINRADGTVEHNY